METATESKAVIKKPQAVRRGPRSKPIASAGIRTANEFTLLMAALMSDLLEGRITPATGNACCNAGGKLLKAVELQFKYGQPSQSGERILELAGRPANGRADE